MEQDYVLHHSEQSGMITPLPQGRITRLVIDRPDRSAREEISRDGRS
ncbi:MAG: hypothetical protein VYC57_03250 [Verrucomicrobiota bacterium]|nr:hypothetical protein [Verrucomicrobiota bacterium]